MKTKTKIIISLLVIYLIVNCIVYNITEINKEQRIKIALDAKIDQLQTHYSILIDQQTKMANAVFRLTMDIKGLIDILVKTNDTTNKDELDKLREQLKEKLSYRYGILKTRGVLQYHIVLPNNISFLRMHKQDKFGDDLTNIRHDMAYANRYKKIVRGFHQGRTAHGFRNIYPIFSDDKSFLGVIEISFSSDTFQNNLMNISKVHTHFLVDKEIFKSNAWKTKELILKYEQSAEHYNYMITMSGIHTRERCIVRNAKKLRPMRTEIDKNIALGKKFSLYNPWKDGIQTATFFPIKNSISNKTVAWIVSYEQSPFIKSTLIGGNIIQLVGFIGLLILFYFIYRTLNQKEILDIQVKEKTEELQSKAEILIKTARELEESEHELEEINKNLEQRVDDEISKNNAIQEQLYKSEKMAAMGEMIGNIAHQWRQPLSVISTTSTGLIMQQELGVLEDNFFKKSCESINDNAQFLSQTINDFSNYIKGDRTVVNFLLKENIDSFVNLVTHSVKQHQINLILNIQDNISLYGYPNELTQCFINIFNNSKDILDEKVKDDRFIFISIYQEENNIFIIFKDNGGGIPENIVDKIFEPYFTTKHQSQGTGLGLNMTYNLIIDGMGGDIKVKNTTYNYNEHEYTGAEFTIILPIDNT